MKNSRRNFLKIAGVSALGLTTTPVLDAFAAGGHKKEPEGIRYGLVIDTNKLSEEANAQMIEACHSIHNVPEVDEKFKKQELKWLWNEDFPHAFPTKEDEFLADKFKDLPILVLCNHCKNPSCVKACPTKATFKRKKDGIVLMDFHRCIGCRFCMAACPFGARSFNFQDPRPFLKQTKPDFPTRMKGVVEKCNMCAERLAKGLKPACVEVSGGAITFGDLNNPESEVRQLLKTNYTIRRKQGLGTEPSVYYIV